MPLLRRGRHCLIQILTMTPAALALVVGSLTTAAPAMAAAAPVPTSSVTRSSMTPVR